MEAKEKVVTDGGDAEEEHILRLRTLLRDLVRKLWRSHGCCQGTGDNPTDRGRRVYGQTHIGDGEFFGLNAVSFDVLNIGRFPSCRSITWVQTKKDCGSITAHEVSEGIPGGGTP